VVKYRQQNEMPNKMERRKQTNYNAADYRAITLPNTVHKNFSNTSLTKS